jgi:hypothetical protein
MNKFTPYEVFNVKVVSMDDKLFEKIFQSQTSSGKLFMDIEAYRLRYWEEIGGIVNSVQDFQGACMVTISSKSILLPRSFKYLFHEGQRAMILRTNEDFRMRITWSTDFDSEILVFLREDGSMKKLKGSSTRVCRKPKDISSRRLEGGRV